MFLLKKNLAAVIIALITIIFKFTACLCKRWGVCAVQWLKDNSNGGAQGPTVTFQVWYKVGSKE